MLRIRLTRVGAKKKPAYRIVIAESGTARDSAAIEVIGQYNPIPNPSVVTIDHDKAREWLRNGAQPSERVARLLSQAGIQ